MEFLRKTSLTDSFKIVVSPQFHIRLLKEGIPLIFYMQLVLLVIYPLILLLDDNEYSGHSWPITLTTPAAQPVATSGNDKIFHFMIQEKDPLANEPAKKILLFEDNSTGRKILQCVLGEIMLLISILITYWLKKLVTNLAERKPFSGENYKRVKWIAWAILFIVFFDIIKTFLHRMYTTSHISLSGARFDVYDWSFDNRSFLLGILILCLAEVFKMGNKYKTDSESIV